jgi:two-component system chemotaxis response regulator CheB
MAMEMKRPLRVLAVDDSAVMRGILRTLFAAHAERPGTLPAMELCGMVQDGVECLKAVLQLRPDVVVLDLEMPRMHGLDVLERLRIEEPALPVIMCSSYTERGARTTVEALALGAADYVMKPSSAGNFAESLSALAGELLPKIAALASVGRMRQYQHSVREAVANEADALVDVLVIGVSTGGPSALEHVLPSLPGDFAVPVLIVQHMPKLFTGALAERLNRLCSLDVREAYEGAPLAAGTVWIAPGDAHMEVTRTAGAGAAVVLHQGRSLNHCKPSVDYLFSSAAAVYGAGTLALVMTGMGSDGLTGARRVHEAGGVVMTQDAASSAVWGMPGRVFAAGISREPIALGRLAAELTRRVNLGRGRMALRSRAGNAPEARLRSEVIHGVL